MFDDVEDIRHRVSLKGGPDGRKAEAYAQQDRLALLEAYDELEREREDTQAQLDAAIKALGNAQDELEACRLPTRRVSARQLAKRALAIIDKALDA